TAQRRGQRLRAGRVAAHHAGAGGHRGGARIAGDRPDLLAAVQQQLHQLAPDVARRSGNQDHGKPFPVHGHPSRGIVSSVFQKTLGSYYMSFISSESADSARRRRRLSTAVKESLRELSIQLSLLNHHVGARVDLKDADLDCLDFINRHGPLSPSALARRAGLHPATMTGIIDRLPRAGAGGPAARDRSTSARRAVLIRALRDRNSELLHLYSGMNTAMDQICAEYGDAELQLLADFLRRTA